MAGEQGGLLAFLNTPEGQGLLAGAFGGLAGARRGQPINSIGRAGMAGLAGYANAQDQGWQNEQRGYQRDQLNKQKQLDALAPQFLKSASQSALGAGAQAGSVGPTMANAGRLESAQPTFDLQGYTNAAFGVDPKYAIGLQASLAKETPFDKVNPKDYTPESVRAFVKTRNFGDLQPLRKMELAPNGQVWNPYQAQPGQTMTDPNKPFSIGPDGRPVANQGYQSYEISKAKAGAASNNVSVNTGQKGLDNEFKLRDGFKAEPVYKAHQEMQSAYGQIQQSLKQASPAGDLAGATKLMKLLDPGSVVRESELGMAMQASGLMDRLTNYGQMVVSGQKLTPTQRKDFQTLADALYGESINAYNSKRSEYEKLGGEYGLNAPRAIGPAAAGGNTPKDSGVDDLVNKYRSK